MSAAAAEIPRLVAPAPDGWDLVWIDDLEEGRKLLGYAERWTSPHGPGGAWDHTVRPSVFHGIVRFEHICDRGERGVIVCAPKLLIDQGHALTCPIGGSTTVTPSILCPDCGTHGWVTDGMWVPA